MAPADIRRQGVVEELDLALDGRLAVVVRRIIRANRYLAHLYAIPLDRGRIARPRRLPSGTVRDSWPRLSPDGSRVAFIRSDPARDEDPVALVVLDLARGGSRRVRR